MYNYVHRNINLKKNCHHLKNVIILDPDIVAGDGVYSRYITKYYGPGRYRFTVFVNDNKHSAYTIQDPRSGRALSFDPPHIETTPVCCGSIIKVPVEHRRHISFHREAVGPVINLIDAPSFNNPIDRMPPSKIGDLRVIVNASSRHLKAIWTAPGDDFDSGSVHKYRFVFSEKINDLYEGVTPTTLVTLDRIDESGTEGIYEFNFDRYDRDYFVGVYAVDEHGNESKLSNVVSVFMPKPEGIPNPNPITPNPESMGDTDWIMIGIVVGVVITLVILLAIILYVYCNMSSSTKRHNRDIKSSGVNVDLQHSANAGSDSSSNSYESDIKNCSSNQLVSVHQHDQ